ncbi:hypothetical protein KC332_g3705 [Hortaea werneckii]|nr:hypothetical protein KC358_g1787 [Hortaea werneckii]KAI6851621.1 hypothetical protein KC350_g1569 [Hortaea werneckii]KAI6942614.1 hypothetical protein KC341_g2096 [Hortaea werneckii]KAI6948381.1 hypothetical protein KC348_g1964 [Hortaea werneckii]KAI6979474.1 hypothetical protein KC321_g2335 [Hortaea werneckii]
MHYWNRQQQKRSQDVDAWTQLQRTIQRLDDSGFLWDNDDDRRKSKQCYEHCYSRLIVLTKAIATTTANARRGVIVIADEAAKDLEINIFNAAFEQAWAGKVSGLICLGDEEQLKDTSTCWFDPVQLAQTRRHGDISLPKRLIAEGFQIEAMYWWRNSLQKAMRTKRNPRDATHYPKLGREDLRTFVDLTEQKVDSKGDIGFDKAVSRVNVALTRGRGVVWTAGDRYKGPLARDTLPRLLYIERSR